MGLTPFRLGGILLGTEGTTLRVLETRKRGMINEEN